MGSLLTSALKLAERGWRVFPCQPCGKVPATPNGCKAATADAAQITAWWKRADFNIGVATGQASNITVVDVDDEDAEAELKKLEEKFGALPPTVESITGRGRHIFYRWPKYVIRNSASKIAPGIDVRGEGGYVIVPPSKHPSGKRYAWSVDSASTFAEAPEWLLNMITSPRGTTGEVTEGWRTLARDGADDGYRNDTLTRFVGHLLSRHVDPEMVLDIAFAINDARIRPPMTRNEVTSIVDSISATELKRRIA
jgi:hypothetical protein